MTGPLTIDDLNSLGVATARHALSKDSFLVAQSKGTGQVCFLQFGWLCRFRPLQTGRRQIIDFTLPGEVTVIDALAGPLPELTVQAITDCEFVLVKMKALIERASADPGFGLRLAATSLRGLVRMETRLSGIVGASAKEAVAFQLLDLFMRVHGTMPKAANDRVNLPITQEHLADALGLTVVHINRTLRALREDGTVEIRGGRLTIMNPEMLCKLADFDMPKRQKDTPKRQKRQAATMR